MRNSFMFFIFALWPLYLFFFFSSMEIAHWALHAATVIQRSLRYCVINETTKMFLVSTFLYVCLYFLPCDRSWTEMKQVLLHLWGSYPKADNPKKKMNTIQQHIQMHVTIPRHFTSFQTVLLICLPSATLHSHPFPPFMQVFKYF